MRSDVAFSVQDFGRNTGLGFFREERDSLRSFSSCSTEFGLRDEPTEVVPSTGTRLFLITTAFFNLRLFLKL